MVCLGEVSSKEHIGDASLALLEHNVFELLNVPAHSGEDLEAVSEHANLVQVTHLNLVHAGV